MWIAHDRADGAGLRQSRCRDAGGEARRAAAAARCGALHAAGRESAPAAEAVAQAAALLKAAKNTGDADRPRLAQPRGAGTRACALAEALGARVITDLKVGASFPTDHPLHLGAPSVLMPDAEGLAALGKADVILSLDWVDLAGTLKAAKAPAANAKVISVSLDYQIHNGWSMDHQGLAPVDLLLAADPEHAVPLLVEALGDTPKRCRARRAAPKSRASPTGPLTVEHLARALRDGGRRQARARSRTCRCPGTARGGRSAIRSTSSAPTAAAGSARSRRHGRRGARAEGHRPHCRSASAATAIS